MFLFRIPLDRYLHCHTGNWIFLRESDFVPPTVIIILNQPDVADCEFLNVQFHPCTFRLGLVIIMSPGVTRFIEVFRIVRACVVRDYICQEGFDTFHLFRSVSFPTGVLGLVDILRQDLFFCNPTLKE